LKKIHLGQTVAILANIGVIAGIIFLGIELQQNNELLAAQARADRRDIHRSANLRELEYPDLFRAKVKTLSGETLDANEQRLIEVNNTAAFIDWQYIYLEYRAGLLQENSIPLPLWRRSFHEYNIGMPQVWSARMDDFDPGFSEWMEENIVNER